MSRILLTGVSSFTGAAFACALARAGNEVVATLTRDGVGAYEGLRRQRLEAAAAAGVRLVPGVVFGGDACLALVREGFDVIGHHAADVTNYKSPDFDALAAVANNTRGLRALVEATGAAWVLTGTYFEPDEACWDPAESARRGAEVAPAVVEVEQGKDPARAFSPYGLSKALTWQVVRHACALAGVPVTKFVLPNPYGPGEEPRFPDFLRRHWAEGKVPRIQTPEYVRDNCPVDALADAYVRACAEAPRHAVRRCNPSGHVESVRQFALRLAALAEREFGRPCPVETPAQTVWNEPACRFNTEPVVATV